MSTKCEKCGHVISIGDFPFCKGSPMDHGPWSGAEEPLEPYLDEALTTEVAPDGSATPYGIEITSRSQRRKIMYANNIEYRKKLPKPGRLFFDMGSKG